MRRHVHREQASMQLKSHHPGCMWGVLHMLDYPGWRQVRKMLPYKRHIGRRSGEGQGIPNYGCVPGTVPRPLAVEEDESVTEEKMTETSRSARGTVTSRLKVRIVEDILRRKGKHHHRSSTNPTKLKTEPVNDVKVDGMDDYAQQSEQDASASLTSDPLSPEASATPLATNDGSETCVNTVWVTFDDNPVECDSQKELTDNHTLIKETLESAKHTLLEQKLMSAKEHTSEAPLYQSKEFLNALDLVNLDKDLLQGILQEQGSNLAHRFQSQQSFKRNPGLRMSESFSIPESHSVEREVVIGSRSPRNREKSQVAIKHFKILKRRLQDAIKESKKEKHRITMDGFLHKIPYGHKLSADVKDIARNWKEQAINKGKKDGSASSCSSASTSHPKAKTGHIRRTSSMGDAMEKYCWLYESSFKKRPDHPPPETSTETEMKKELEEHTKKSLGRILSLPDLKSYYLIPNEYLNDSYTSKSSITSPADVKSLSSNNSFNFTADSVKNEVQLASSVDNHSQDHLKRSLGNDMLTEELDVTFSIAGADLADTRTCRLEPGKDAEFEFSFQLDSAHLDDLSPYSQELQSTVIQHDEVVSVDEHQLENRTVSKGRLHLHIDLRDEIEYNYVKNVLDLAGLSRNHPHESWHATDQPVDPAVYDEVEGCLSGPDATSASYNHLIMFDVINEVLMDMYEKSFSYCPVNLSSLCRIRQMPTGDRVLSEVWSSISCYFSSKPAFDDTLDYIVSHDLAKSSGWMNLQFDTECVGLELEDMIFDDLLDEAVVI